MNIIINDNDGYTFSVFTSTFNICAIQGIYTDISIKGEGKLVLASDNIILEYKNSIFTIEANNHKISKEMCKTEILYILSNWLDVINCMIVNNSNNNL